MTATRDQVVAQRVAEAPTLYTAIMQNAYSGKASPRAGIKAQCLICVGYQRETITNCTGFSCPLWAYRPYQKQGENEGDDHAA